MGCEYKMKNVKKKLALLLAALSIATVGTGSLTAKAATESNQVELTSINIDSKSARASVINFGGYSWYRGQTIGYGYIEYGDSVRCLQTALNRILGSGLTVDGYYGPATYNAIRNFQIAFLTKPIDGIAGVNTFDTIALVLGQR